MAYILYSHLLWYNESPINYYTLWGTTHDAHTARGSTSLSHTLCDGKVDVMDNEDAQGRTSEREGTVVMLAGT